MENYSLHFKKSIYSQIPEINFKKYNAKPPEFPDNQPAESADESDETWASEDQQRLEELLLEYPPEVVEMRRFEKISKVLGNRTVQQVACRAQKYFQELQAAGMPVPGRIRKAKSRCNYMRSRKSMIFPAYNKVPEADSSSTDGASSSTNGATRLEPNEEKSRIVAILQAVKEAKNNLLEEVKHEGFTCDLCLESPVIGIRWHCSHNDCILDSVNFCSDCMIDQVVDKSKRHPLHHDFIPYGDFNDDDDFESEEEDWESEK